MSREVQQLAIEPVSGTVRPIAQSHGASHDRVEDRLDVRRRARDDPEDLARRGLLLQGLGEPGVRLGQLARARLDLLLEVRVGLLELAGGAVELLAQRLELVSGPDLDAVTEIPGADAGRALAERPDRRDHPPGEEHARQDRQPEAQQEDDRAADDRSSERGVRVRERLLDENEPAEARDRHMGGEDPAALEAFGHRRVLDLAGTPRPGRLLGPRVAHLWEA
jgi:hypothetical protein